MSNIFTQTAHNIQGLQDEIESFKSTALPSSPIPVDKRSLQLFFRGHSDEAYFCAPSVFRNNLLSYEHKIYHDSIAQFPYEFNYLNCEFDRIAKMQHYGAATRILDFTVNPLIALYFSCKTHLDVNGQVIIYRTESTNQSNIGVKALSILATYKNEIDVLFFDYVRKIIGENYSDDYLIAAMRKSYFVIPKITNERLYRQKGLFLIFGQDLLNIPAEKNTSKLDDNFGRGEEYPGYIGYIKIPSEAKNSILEALKNEGITDDFIYPNIEKELEKLCKECSNVNFNLR